MNKKRLIDADAISLGIKLALKHLDVGESDWLNGYVDGLDATKDLIKQAPTVDAVEVVHGRWIVDRKRMCAECSECGKGLNFSDEMQIGLLESMERYCYYCGAKMDGDENEA